MSGLGVRLLAELGSACLALAGYCWHNSCAMIDTKTEHSNGLLPASINRTQARDTGMAMVLLCLIVFAFTSAVSWVWVAIVLLVVTMTVPMAFKPLGYLWFGLSQALGSVVSRILLTAVFFLLVTPMGMIRRRMGRDSLDLNQWKKGHESVFKTRNQVFSDKDIEQPF